MPDIIEYLAARYEGEHTEIARGVNDFVSMLLKEGLVVLADGLGSNPAVYSGPVTNSDTGGRQPFQAPVLVLYNDMEGLLLIDPVHDAKEP